MPVKMMLSILLLLSLAAAGCNGARETDEIAYVLTIGIDKAAEPGMLNITYQIAVPRALAAGGGGGETDASKTSFNITVIANSTAEARNLLNSQVARSVNVSHTKTIIIGEALARDGLNDVLSPLMRYREYRGSMYILIAKGTTAQELLAHNKPLLDTVQSRYFESMLLTATDSGYYLRTNLHEFYMGLKSSGASSYAALLGINPKSLTSSPSASLRPPEVVPEYTAGSTPRKGGNALEILGTGIFRSDRMVGTLTSEETRMLAILKNNFRRGFLVLDDPLVPGKTVSLAVRLGSGPKLAVEIVDGKPLIKVDIFLEGEMAAIPSSINYESEDKRPLLEQQVSELITQEMQKFLYKTRDLGSDAAGFGDYVRYKFRTHQEWLDAQWEDMYTQAEFAVTVKTTIRRTGLLLRSSPYDKF